VRLYLAVARLTFGQYSTYRGATVAGIFTNTVFGFILASVVRGAIGDRTIGGLDRSHAALFTFTAQSMLMVISAFGDQQLAARVRSGEVATELHRPWDWSSYRLAADLGRSFYYALARGVPPFALGWVVYRFPLPHVGRFLLFFVAVALAAVLASRWWTAVGLTSFWLIDGSGVVQLATVATMASSGAIVPLNLFPPWLQDIMRVLPFSGMLQRPIEVLLGLSSLPKVIAFQLVWIAAFEVLLRFELRTASKRLVIQGG
jgi:ABC-2 type transport system permease protein